MFIAFGGHADTLPTSLPTCGRIGNRHFAKSLPLQVRAILPCGSANGIEDKACLGKMTRAKIADVDASG